VVRLAWATGREAPAEREAHPSLGTGLSLVVLVAWREGGHDAKS